MSIMKVTLIGLETYLSHEDKSLFDNMNLPEGINKEDVVNNILLSGGEFEPVYSEPFFLRSVIGYWSNKHYRTFEKWLNALNLEYNPIENYNRKEAWTDTTDNDTSTSGRTDSGNTRTFNNQDKRTLDTENKRTLDTEDKETRDIEDKTTFDKTTTTEHEVSALDSSTYQASSKDTVDEDGDITVDGTGTDTFTHSGTDTMNNSGTDTVDYSGTIKDEYGEGFSSTGTNDTEFKHSGRVHGNIGVTTSQQMLQSELDLARFNLVQEITDLFVLEFCVMVYD